MADRSSIEWTDATWNPIVGCSIVSPGCTNCYAMRQAARIEKIAEGAGRATHYAGTTRQAKDQPVWTGRLALAPEAALTAPLRWSQPRRVFVNSMGDLFHEDVPDAWLDRVFAVMAEAYVHTFQVLTKRSARMRAYLSDPDVTARIGAIQQRDHGDANAYCNVALDAIWPLANVWLGVSAERQQEAAARIPDLLATPASMRFVSAEPLLGPIDFNWNGLPGLDWIIVGGESGPDARPMHPDWARSIRDQCDAAGVAFFFKQWGAWAPGEAARRAQTRTQKTAFYFNERWMFSDEEMRRDDEPDVWRLGKRAAGRLLDGREHNAMPGRMEQPL